MSRFSPVYGMSVWYGPSNNEEAYCPESARYFKEKFRCVKILKLPVFPLVVRCATSKRAWETVQQRFER